MNVGPATGQFLTFFVGDEQFAATASDVSQVFRRPLITRVPNSPPSLLGIARLRGEAAPVVSLARLLGREEHVTNGSRLLLLSGEQSIGLAVDRVGALTAMTVEAGAQGGQKQGFGRLYAVEDATLRVLDLDALLRREFAGTGGARRGRAVTEVADQDSSAEQRMAFLGFELAGQAYALPLEEVSEVLTLPPNLAVIAQSDDASLGVVNLRGRLVPIVSLRRLLGLQALHDASHRVVVTHIGDAVVGLAVDRLQAILRVPADTIDPAPAVLNAGEGEAQVQTICRLPGGAGLVAILSAQRLFRDEKIAHILADGRGESGEMEATSDEIQTVERFIIFRLGTEEYGLPLSAVDEITRLPERLVRVPKAPAFVEGVINLRGKVIPVIDQRSRFAAARGTGDARPRIVVTTVAGKQAGFIVDTVSEIIGLTDDQISPTPELTEDAGRLFSRIATIDGGKRLILLVEPTELLDRAERELLASLETASVAAEA